MRHHNPRSSSPWSRNYRKPVYEPYQQPYSWMNATPECRYIKVLKFILANPGCKRVDIIRSVWGLNGSVNDLRGYSSKLFANMLYSDLIDYNDRYEYCITDYGRRVLRRAGITEITVTTKVAV